MFNSVLLTLKNSFNNIRHFYTVVEGLVEDKASPRSIILLTQKKARQKRRRFINQELFSPGQYLVLFQSFNNK